jgi:hypothetical protein
MIPTVSIARTKIDLPTSVSPMKETKLLVLLQAPVIASARVAEFPKSIRDLEQRLGSLSSQAHQRDTEPFRPMINSCSLPCVSSSTYGGMIT